MTPYDSHARELDCDTLRDQFSLLLSEMYRKEVPLYGDLIRIVKHVDDEHFASQDSGGTENVQSQLPRRQTQERHGAIRLGSSLELRTIGRLFAIFGMYAVGYYDLSVVGFPLHATAFRPLYGFSLKRSPFRVFTTILRNDLLTAKNQDLIASVLSKRRLFSDPLMELIEKWETGVPLSLPEKDDLLNESLKIFKWHGTATVSLDEYATLKKEHPILADIVCFPSAHINHLTPRTWNIDMVQRKMIAEGLPVKERIEGPPPRKCDILLRQTSFKALEERVIFQGVEGSHSARFGEIEQRGAALTPKGRALYDKLLYNASSEAEQASATACQFDTLLRKAFEAFPDTWWDLRSQNLIFCQYSATPAAVAHATSRKLAASGSASLLMLLETGAITFKPLTYEDFLPVSAAGIFTSNLGFSAETQLKEARPDRDGLEAALGNPIIDETELYAKLQADSLDECRDELCLQYITEAI